MWVGEDGAGNATWDEFMNHLQVKLWYLTFITKVAGSHHTVVLRLGYNQRGGGSGETGGRKTDSEAATTRGVSVWAEKKGLT